MEKSVIAMVSVFHNLPASQGQTDTPHIRGLRLFSTNIQYHGCWFPGSLHCQGISKHGIEYLSKTVPVRLMFSKQISAACIMLILHNLILKYSIYFETNQDLIFMASALASEFRGDHQFPMLMSKWPIKIHKFAAFSISNHTPVNPIFCDFHYCSLLSQLSLSSLLYTLL